MEMLDYIIVILGGLFAGAINSLAGFGSLITLTILMEVVGLSPNIANGTNRVNVMANVLASSAGFMQNGKLKLKKVWPIVIIVVLGAIAGAVVATRISNEDFRFIYRILIVFVGILLLTKPKKWMIKETLEKKINWIIATPIFLLLGFYAGLIQAGAGLFFLATLVLFARKEIFEANAIKAFIILAYSSFVIYTFHSQGLIDWKAGSLLAVFQAIGAYFTSRFAPRMKNANIWAYRILVFVVLGIIAREIYLFL